MWAELGEHRLRLDTLEHEASDTSPLIKKLREIEQEIEQASREYVSGERQPAFLDPYTPIVHMLEQKFSIDELAALAHDVGIKMENVGGTTLLEMCRRLVEYAARRNKLLDLMTMAGSEDHRPPLEQWTELL